ncbi:PilN domain-containing protein [Marinilactibacillus sp. GCM10026970]|uniref:PilN domain-containing protein n=1 Tax=Marinilactibacillus sp. GCM10026970 TaxID=3252642 RepID=UPI00361FCED9
MININLFEKKQINRLPYIIVTTFLTLLSILFLYLFIMNRYYTLQDQHNMRTIENQVSEVQQARKIEQLNLQTIQLEESISTIEDNQHNMPYLFEDLNTYLPEDESRITTFTLLENFTLVIALNSMDYVAITEMIESLNTIDYVHTAELLTLTVDETNIALFDSEISISLDQTLLREEGTDEN